MATEKSTVKLILKSFPNLFFQKYDLNILRFMQVSPLMLHLLHSLNTKKVQFVNLHLNRLAFSWTLRSLLILTGKKNGLYLICSIFIFVSIHFPFIDVWIEISCLNILSLYHPGNWQWRITNSFHLGAIICEIFCLKRVLDFGTSERLWGEFQTSNFKKSKSIIYLELLIITMSICRCLHSTIFLPESIMSTKWMLK